MQCSSLEHQSRPLRQEARTGGRHTEGNVGGENVGRNVRPNLLHSCKTEGAMCRLNPQKESGNLQIRAPRVAESCIGGRAPKFRQFLSGWILAFSGLLVGCAQLPDGERSVAQPSTPVRMQVRTTAYTHTEVGGSRNAIGSRLRFGSDTSSAAADWSWMPVGTRFRLVATGREYVVEDYGRGLIGKKTVDLYMPDVDSMRQWGVRTVDIEILEWGSKVVSKMLLARGARGSGVRRMLSALESGE